MEDLKTLKNSGIRCTPEVYVEAKLRFDLDLDEINIGDSLVLEDREGGKFKLECFEQGMVIERISDDIPTESKESEDLDDDGVILSDDIDTCPFCESNNIDVFTKEKNKKDGVIVVAYVECNDCGARGPRIKFMTDSDNVSTAIDDSVECSIDKWNDRQEFISDNTPDDVKEKIEELQNEFKEAIGQVKSNVRDIAESIDKDKIKDNVATMFTNIADLIKKS